MICPERPANGRDLQFSLLQPFFKKSAAPPYPRNDVREIRRLSPMKSTPPNRSFSGKPLPSPCHPDQREGSAVLASATILQEECLGATVRPEVGAEIQFMEWTGAETSASYCTSS
jgi:hypothetical protein